MHVSHLNAKVKSRSRWTEQFCLQLKIRQFNTYWARAKHGLSWLQAKLQKPLESDKQFCFLWIHGEAILFPSESQIQENSYPALGDFEQIQPDWAFLGLVSTMSVVDVSPCPTITKEGVCAVFVWVFTGSSCSGTQAFKL